MNTGGDKPRVNSWPMWVLGLVLLVDQMDQSVARGVQGPIQQHFGVGDFGIGVMLSAFVVVNGFVTLPAGYLADRLPRVRTIGNTVILWSVISALCAFAPTFGVLVLIRAGLGFGQAITEPAAASLLADFYPGRERGRAFSIQQALIFVGIGLGFILGGVVTDNLNLSWRWAFAISALPGLAVAVLVFRLREPNRGAGDRVELGVHGSEADESGHLNLFEGGWRQFGKDMIRGLRDDLRTIWAIPTMRYALVGVSALLFTISAIAAGLPQFYERELGVAAGDAEKLIGLMAIIGGVPGVLVGGVIADKWVTRFPGARVAIPAWCILVGNLFFVVSWLDVPFSVAFPLELIGFFVVVMSIPPLRAGLTDTVPANLRGAGFGAFNLCSILFGAAAAPFVLFGLSDIFDDNLRTAFLLVSPPVFAGGFVLLAARKHLEADMGKMLEAVYKAVMAAQAETEQRAAQHLAASSESAQVDPCDVSPPTEA